MARASTPTLIPLDQVAHILQVDPLHFNSILTDNRPAPIYQNEGCNDIWLQHAYQDYDKFSREELAMALNAAEHKTARELGYYPIPVWIEDEQQLTQPGIYGYSSRNTLGQSKSVLTKWGYVIEGGIRGVSAIEEGAATVFSDSNGDGYDDLVTVTVATTVTDDEEIKVYYPDKSAKQIWEIRPINVTISGGIATITFPKYLIPLENLVEKLPTPEVPDVTIDGDDNTNFLTTVDVYRIYNDPSQQIVFYVEPENCCSGDCDLTEATGCLYIRDEKRGIVAYRQATWSDTTEAWSISYTTCNVSSSRAKFYYRAGLRDPWSDERVYSRMNPNLERLIAYYSIVNIDKYLCICNNFASTYRLLNTDLAEVPREGSRYAIDYRLLSNPFGTTRAGIELWNYVKSHRLGRTLDKGT